MKIIFIIKNLIFSMIIFCKLSAHDVGCCSVQNLYAGHLNEDRFYIKNMQFKQGAIWGVFDGHKSSLVSSELFNSFHNVFESYLSQNSIFEAFKKTFAFIDERILSSSQSAVYSSGSTAVVACLFGKELYLANVGDSSGTFFRDGIRVFSTIKHKPVFHSKEAKRIFSAGGKISCRYRFCLGQDGEDVEFYGYDYLKTYGFVGNSMVVDWNNLASSDKIVDPLVVKLLKSKKRGDFKAFLEEYFVRDVAVDSSVESIHLLGMSRSIGDRQFKQMGVISLPDISGPFWITGKNEFLILGSDGFWDVIDEDCLADEICSLKRYGKSAQQISEHLANLAKNPADDVTVLVVLFGK